MTRWAVITVALYVVLLVVFTIPLFLTAMLDPGVFDAGAHGEAEELLEVYRYWIYWAVIAVVGAAQALFLVVPVRARQNLVLKKRHFAFTILAAALFMGVLFTGAMMAVEAAFHGDKGPEGYGWWLLGTGLAAWAFWFVVFGRFAGMRENPSDWMQRVTSYVYRGSIAELIVAVASHIIVRRRGDCSAPECTAIGIFMGLAVMLLSFGPGVFYLFAARRERMLSKKERRAAGEKPPGGKA